MNYTNFVTMAIIGWLAVSGASALAEEKHAASVTLSQDELTQLMVDVSSLGARQFTRTVKKGEVPKATVIEIDQAGAHLPMRQNILFVGPINDDYYLIPFDNGNAAGPHQWLSGVYHAQYTGKPAGLKTFYAKINVQSADMHASPTTHDYVLIFLEEDAAGRPKSVAFNSPIHTGTKGGSHGGGAHGNQ